MDPELATRAQRGDAVAFAAITQASHGRLKQVASRILCDRHLAQDAMQQAPVEIWRKLPSLRDPARFEAWSCRVLVYACYREEKRHRRSFGQASSSTNASFKEKTDRSTSAISSSSSSSQGAR